MKKNVIAHGRVLGYVYVKPPPEKPKKPLNFDEEIRKAIVSVVSQLPIPSEKRS